MLLYIVATTRTAGIPPAVGDVAMFRLAILISWIVGVGAIIREPGTLISVRVSTTIERVEHDVVATRAV